MPLDDSEIGRVYSILKGQMENIVLIGMPGCGKSTVGRLLAEKCGRRFVDADEEIERAAKKSIPAIIAEDGENIFRAWETKILGELGKESGLVIATGGGCVTRAENYPLLHQNGRIFWLQRDLDRLPTDGRPLSIDLQAMYRVREPMYTRFADRVIDNNGAIENTLSQMR